MKGICKHYNGREIVVSNAELCNAGVSPLEIATNGTRKTEGWVKKAPCFEKNIDAPLCKFREFPTPEEIKKEEEEMSELISNVALIVDRIPDTGNSGTVECPKCKGTVEWVRTRSNGHCHARCKTKDCISFME